MVLGNHPYSVRHTMKHHPTVAFVAPYRLYLPIDFFDVLVDEQIARVKAVPLPPVAAEGARRMLRVDFMWAHPQTTRPERRHSEKGCD